MDIIKVAMEVLMNACDGRNMVDKSIECMVSADFEKAETLLAEAEKLILKAHIAQTETIQSQAAGESVEYSLLFIHAQDTLMTSMSELRIIKSLLPVFVSQNEQINRLKGGEA